MQAKEIQLPLIIHRADTSWKRLKGLLFYKEPIMEEGLLITPCNSIHMFFMRFAIDVVFLDQANKVVKVVSGLKPWKMIPPVSNAYATLELPTGTIANQQISIGDTISL
ncbi:DUF192 domain-containing protein [Lederbergia wuyishanensis]|uniref:Uncharacterized membrane protein (UPF0127 family) n=1 Tax=Lederbergia wuyishanensis TaxID=1347903 RepID=A0ABU0D880_9BACI|nr:DUF192 domain-containing protein [Lederbergia wuyishanensis]MCJ8009239.1 DUF192 domain-containing protein [Lederbergia wuyishanensis]MDQ0344628.1 uncharacterized membrane protein (UPF0127 family) [Lederbergia wuyishanensis]